MEMAQAAVVPTLTSGRVRSRLKLSISSGIPFE